MRISRAPLPQMGSLPRTIRRDASSRAAASPLQSRAMSHAQERLSWGAKRNEIYVAASRSRDGCRIYLDREGIEKSARSQMPLSGTARFTIPKEKLRQHLSEAWGRAQTKSSTRDFKSSTAPVVQQRQEKTVPDSASKNIKMRLPRIELGR